MKKLNLITLIILSLFLANSCDFVWDCLDGNGIEGSEYRYLDNFDGIVSTGSYNIYVYQGNDYEILIETDDNLLPFIITEISGSNLKIKSLNGKCLNPTRSIDIYVTLPEIYELKLTGSGIIEAEDLNSTKLEVGLLGSGRISLGMDRDTYIQTDELIIEHTGSGDIKVDVEADYVEADLSGSGSIEILGTTYDSDLSISGSGNIHTYDLTQQNCEAKITGSGNIYVYVEKYLNALITGSGNIYYKGHPDLDSRITGSGSIRNRN